MPVNGINYLIYMGQGKAILWASVIQVGVININLPPSIFLWDYHHFRQPV